MVHTTLRPNAARISALPRTPA